ncbi:MAG: hypothetical protein IKJ06_05205 [Clostridia bacterium]|nr:hypothetical protein [Clostridia bacterium]
MKKIALVLSLCMILTLVACGEKKDVMNNAEDQKVETPVVEQQLPEKEEAEKPEVKPEEKPAEKPVQQSPQNKPNELPAEKPQEKPEVKPEEKPVVKEELSVIMADITANLGEMPMLMNEPLTEENFEFFTFAKYVNGAEAFVSEPMMGSFAHSVVLVRLPKGADATAFANEVRANADARKWICVEAEKVTVTQKGDLVLLVMSSADRTDKITNAFKAR